jgi:long-chain fatty acid transport protein
MIRPKSLPFNGYAVVAGIILAIGIDSFLTSKSALAGSGIEVRTGSVVTLGSAQAGMTAELDNISEMVLNPAALGFGSGTEVAVGAVGIFNSSTADNLQAATALGTPITGNNGGNAGVSALLPNIYAGFGVNSQLRLGLGVTSFYGLGTSFSAGWVGRYQVLSANLLTLDIVPVMSYRPIPELTLAVGPVVQYAAARTDVSIDFGTLNQVLFGGAFEGIPAQSDGSFSSTSTGWAAGYLLGAAWEPASGTKIGLSYRSQIRQGLGGTGRFEPGGPTGAAIAATTGAFGVSGFTTTINLPPIVSLGIAQRATEALTLFADLQWAGWQSLQSLSLNFSNPAQPPVVTQLALQNSWFGAIGGKYQINQEVAVRAGVAFDRSTLPPNAARGPIIPDTNTYWLAFGVQFVPTPKLQVDFAYGHLFFDRATLSVPITQPGNTFRGSLSGTINTSSNYVALQATYRF